MTLAKIRYEDQKVEKVRTHHSALSLTPESLIVLFRGYTHRAAIIIQQLCEGNGAARRVRATCNFNLPSGHKLVVAGSHH